LAEKVEDPAGEIRETFLGAMSALAFALEAKDSYTAGHSRRVADIAVAIGKKLSLKEDELEDLRWGSLLHDMAKIAVDERIINKNGELSPKDYEHVMTHPIVGACIVGSVVTRKRITEVIQYHHAHYNGHGFRQKLIGQDIPLLAKIVAVADAYDAMTSNRPYRPALSREEALARIRSEIHRQFDPLVAHTFLKMSGADIMTERKKILISDDEESIRLLVRSVLGNDYTVIEAIDGQEAVDIAQNHKPALILMDVMMPKKDGFQACYEVKANLTTRAIPVVMLTVIEEVIDRRFASDLGAAGYITKPFTPQDLLDTVDKFLKSPAMT
jgi:energy-coupling factor transport system substrate-specific component